MESDLVLKQKLLVTHCLWDMNIFASIICYFLKMHPQIFSGAFVKVSVFKQASVYSHLALSLESVCK